VFEGLEAIEQLNSIEDIKVLKEFLILFPISCSINSKSVSIFFWPY
jgi:hypothetical protein